jgi:cytochrome P450
MTMLQRNTALTVPSAAPSKPQGILNSFQLVGDPVGFNARLFKRHGKIVAIAGEGTKLYSPLPRCPGIVLTYGPETTQQVTTQHEVYYKYPLTGKNYPTGDVTPRTRPLRTFLTGLFGVNSDQHRQHRRLLMPASHRKRVESYCDTMVGLTQEMLEGWQPGEARDLALDMQLLTLKVATRTLFGADAGVRGEQMGHALHRALRLIAHPLTTLAPYNLPGLPYREFLDIARDTEQNIREIIKDKRAAGADGDDVLSTLTQAQDEETGAKLTEEELLGHTEFIFTAGHETSANALTWALFLLSQHPEVMTRLYEALESVLQGQAPTLAQIPQLHYLEYVIKESMRVLPVAIWNTRVTSEETELAGYVIPEGTEVWLSIYHTHHMPELYPEPERFHPERWETIKPSAFEYNPFSAGPRMCIGATFAMMEIKIVLAMLLQRYRLQLAPKARLDCAGIVTMGPKQGLLMLVNRQDQNFAEGVGGVRANVREMVMLPA